MNISWKIFTAPDRQIESIMFSSVVSSNTSLKTVRKYSADMHHRHLKQMKLANLRQNVKISTPFMPDEMSQRELANSCMGNNCDYE